MQQDIAEVQRREHGGKAGNRAERSRQLDRQVTGRRNREADVGRRQCKRREDALRATDRTDDAPAARASDQVGRLARDGHFLEDFFARDLVGKPRTHDGARAVRGMGRCIRRVRVCRAADRFPSHGHAPASATLAIPYSGIAASTGATIAGSLAESMGTTVTS